MCPSCIVHAVPDICSDILIWIGDVGMWGYIVLSAEDTHRGSFLVAVVKTPKLHQDHI